MTNTCIYIETVTLQDWQIRQIIGNKDCCYWTMQVLEAEKKLYTYIYEKQL